MFIVEQVTTIDTSSGQSLNPFITQRETLPSNCVGMTAFDTQTAPVVKGLRL
jgi:hypothetical protein